MNPLSLSFHRCINPPALDMEGLQQKAFLYYSNSRKKLDAKLENVEMAKAFEKKFNISASLAIIAFSAFSIFLVLFVWGSNAFSNLVGFVYPVYASFKAIKSKKKEDDSYWLTYWVVYAFFNLTESFTDLMLFWVPMYFWVKTSFLVWCMHPKTRGAQKVYVSFIEPLLEKAFTDENVAAAEKLAQDIQNGVKRKVVTDFNETA